MAPPWISNGAPLRKWIAKLMQSMTQDQERITHRSTCKNPKPKRFSKLTVWIKANIYMVYWGLGLWCICLQFYYISKWNQMYIPYFVYIREHFIIMHKTHTCLYYYFWESAKTGRYLHVRLSNVNGYHWHWWMSSEAKLKKVCLKLLCCQKPNAVCCFFVFFLTSIFLLRKINKIAIFILLYKIVVHQNEIQKCKSLGHVSFIYHVWCFCTANCYASVLQCLNMCLNIMLENEMDFEFVFGHFLLKFKNK